MKMRISILLISLSVVAAASIATIVSAADAKVYRPSAQNSAESFVMNKKAGDGKFAGLLGPYCHEDGVNNYNIGALWATLDNSANSSIVVPFNASTVGIKIFSSAYGCTSLAKAAKNSQLIEMSVCTPDPKITQGMKPLSGSALSLQNATIKRGNKYRPNGSISAGTGWTHLKQSDNFARATLSVSGIPLSDLGYGQTKTFRACIKSRYYADDTDDLGSYKREFTIRLTRGAQPTWKMTGTTYSSVNSSQPGADPTAGGYSTSNKTAKLGDKIYFTSRLSNENTPTTVTSSEMTRYRERMIRNLDKSQFTCASNASWSAADKGCVWKGTANKKQFSKNEIKFYAVDPSDRLFRTVGSGDLGKQFCERYYLSKVSYNSNQPLYTTWRCVDVPGWVAKGTTSLVVRRGGVVVPSNQAAPGDTATWTHRVVNDQTGKTDKVIRSVIGRSGFASNGDMSAVNTPAGVAKGGDIRKSFTTTYIIKATDVGKELCQQIKWTPETSTNSGQGKATYQCVTTPYAFELEPNITGGSDFLTPGSEIPALTPTVRNEIKGAASSTTATPGDINWQLNRFEVPKGASKPTSTTNGMAPCTYFKNSCANLADGTGKRSFPVGLTTFDLINGQTVSDDVVLGTSICFGLSVQPRSSSSSEWSHAVHCFVIGKRPTVQVWGGDARIKGEAKTSLSFESTGTSKVRYGSWAEYGMLTRGVNKDMSSASGLARGRVVEGPDNRLNYHRYTFSNVGSTYGQFNFANSTSIATQFKALATTGSIATSVGAGGLNTGVYLASNNVQINGGTIEPGRTIIINATGKSVTITGDITYRDTSYTSTANLPQLVIIADNIYIQKSVKNVDAWLLATGAIDTCSNEGTPGVMPTSGNLLRQGVCGEHLLVNGPVATNRLVLKRTAGALPGPDRDKAAETFNLRADAYLWLHNRSSAGAQAWTTTTNEMPARY